MRICKSKADLKRCTKVETSRIGNTNCTVLDGCAIMWCIAWPLSSQALVRDYVESFKNYLRSFRLGDVYLVFDRYIAYSTKCSARKARARRIYKLSANPSQKHTFTNTDNKKQLIQIIIEMLVSEAVILGSYQSRLIITGQEYTPIEIAPGGVVIRREDLRTTHEEADVIIAIYAAKEERKNVVVMADDTDVYVLLLHHYQAESI